MTKVSAHVYRPRKSPPTLNAMHRRYGRLRARAAATLAPAGEPAGHNSV